MQIDSSHAAFARVRDALIAVARDRRLLTYPEASDIMGYSGKGPETESLNLEPACPLSFSASCSVCSLQARSLPAAPCLPRLPRSPPAMRPTRTSASRPCGKWAISIAGRSAIATSPSTHPIPITLMATMAASVARDSGPAHQRGERK